MIKVIQVLGGESGVIQSALCDDGSMWTIVVSEKDSKRRVWARIPEPSFFCDNKPFRIGAEHDDKEGNILPEDPHGTRL